jgi:hypothetical protein
VLQRDFAPAALSDVSWILDAYAIVLAALLLPVVAQLRRRGWGDGARLAAADEGCGYW